MDDGTRFTLNRINKRFYRDRSNEFSDTRSRPWPGWTRVIARPPFGQVDEDLRRSPFRILDVGCGNGRFALFLRDNLPVPFSYSGIDASPELLELTRLRLERRGIRELNLEQADLVEVGLPSGIENKQFDLIVVFGFLHHIPGFSERSDLLQRLSLHLSPEGILALSFWQFGTESRFRSRVLSWSESTIETDAGIDPDRLEQGDFLLSWGPSEETGEQYDPDSYRYCHHATDAEIERLLARLDLEVEDSFRSDGSGNALNHYKILRSGP